MRETEVGQSLEDMNLNDLTRLGRRLLGDVVESAATTPRQLPVRPWPDTTAMSRISDIVITEEQLIVIVPPEMWKTLAEILPILDEMANRVTLAEDKAKNEWSRGQELGKQLEASTATTNNWRALAEDYDGSSFAARARHAEARVADLMKALSFYADSENWNPEPALIRAGASVKDKGGVAREALK